MNQQVLSPHQAQTKVEGVGTSSTFATEPGFGKASAIFVTSPPPSGTSGRWLFLRNRACREEQTYSSCSPPRRAVRLRREAPGAPPFQSSAVSRRSRSLAARGSWQFLLQTSLQGRGHVLIAGLAEECEHILLVVLHAGLV